MSTGIRASEDCVAAFNALKMNRKYRYVTFKIENDEVVVDKLGDAPEETFTREEYEKFYNMMPRDDCRYAVYEFVVVDGKTQMEKGKLVFIAWSPDSAPIKKKMMYAGTKASFKKPMEPLDEVQSNDLDELSFDHIRQRFSS